MTDQNERKDEDERKAPLLWRAYKLYDKGASWYDRIGWFLSLFKTNAGMTVAVAAVGAAGTTGAVLIKEKIIDPHRAQIETAALPEPEPAPQAVRQNKNSVVFAIKGKDKAGRTGTFDVVVLNKSFLWVRGSSDELEKDGQTIASDALAAAVLDDEVRAALADAIEVIAVGTASQEGVATEEVARAERRARRAAEIVSQGVTGNVPVWTLNLGQYREPCEGCETGGTSWQRPFIVIAVKSLEDGANVGEALADAMTGQDKLPTPESYSAFSLTRFQ